MQKQAARISWQWGILAGIFLLLFGLYPQMRLWHLQGENWHGGYAYNDLDEMAYAAYLQALIDGRPRKNDPYTGRDDSPEMPQPESLFSIQFFSPFLIASLARVFGASASTALIFTSAIAAFLAALALFWLIAALTRDSLFAFTATLITLCCGVVVIGEGAVMEILSSGTAYPYFPFLRRYIPAVPFPFFFVFCGCVWKMLGDEKRRFMWCPLAAACFAVLVYSYFYLWTTAAAWLACLVIVWLIFRPETWRRDFRSLAVLGGLAFAVLVPYFFLLANRAATTDNVQLLVHTRLPDLFRAPEIWSYFSLTLICFAIWKRFIAPNDKFVLFTISLALVPLAVFNQQIITGRSLQPIHYQVFIVNYVALAAFLLAVFIVWRGRHEVLTHKAKFVLPVLALIAIGWGAVESYYPIYFLDDVSIARDNAKLVGNRLTELAKTELFDENGSRALTLNLNLLQGDDQPTVAPQGVLWARHLHVFSGSTAEEERERFYQFLYYGAINENELRRQLRKGNIVLVIALFGWGRHTARLTSEFKPLTNAEIEDEVTKFAQYQTNFSFDQASRLKLSYIVADIDTQTDFSNLDRWYERDEGEQIGPYTLYRVKLRR